MEKGIIHLHGWNNDYMNVEDTILYHSSFCSQILVYSDVISFFTMLNSHMLGMHFPSEFLLDTIYLATKHDYFSN